jgi:hypothetical protein
MLKTAGGVAAAEPMTARPPGTIARQGLMDVSGTSTGPVVPSAPAAARPWDKPCCTVSAILPPGRNAKER